MAHRHLLTAVLGGVLALTGCSDTPTDADATTGATDATDAPATEAGGATPTSGDTTRSTGADVPTEQDTSEDTEAEADATTEEGSGDGSEGSVPVDEQVRHPNGAVLTVTGMTFADPVVDVDMEVLNGSSLDVYLHIQNWDDQLRLVDDLGNSYRFVAPESETEDSLIVAPAESVGGTFRFLGPIVPEASSLSVAWNVDDGEVDGFDISEERDRTDAPGFVVAGLPVSP